MYPQPGARNTPTRSAGAATRRCSSSPSPSWYIRTTARKERLIERQPGDQLGARAHQERPLRQLAGEQYRLGHQPRALLGHAAADLGMRLRAPGVRRQRGGVEREGRAKICPSLDLHRPYIDEITLTARNAAARCAACPTCWMPGSTAAPCRSRSGTIPSRTTNSSPRAVRRRLHLRGGGPDARLVLQPARALHAALRPPGLQKRHLPGPHSGRKGPEDEQAQGQRGRPVDGARRARRRRAALVSLHLHHPGQPAPLLQPTWWASRCASSCSRCGTPTASSSPTPTWTAGRPQPAPRATASGAHRPLGAVATAGADQRGDRRSWKTTRSPRRRAPSRSFIDNLSNWYLRRNRRRFWKSEADADKQAAYSTLYTCLVTVAKLMAPFAPFVSEEIYRNLTQRATQARRRACTWPIGRWRTLR